MLRMPIEPGFPRLDTAECRLQRFATENHRSSLAQNLRNPQMFWK